MTSNNENDYHKSIPSNLNFQMAKKIAQLTKVIYAFNCKLDDKENVLKTFKRLKGEEINEIKNKFVKQIEILRQKNFEEENAGICKERERYGIVVEMQSNFIQKLESIRNEMAARMDAESMRLDTLSMRLIKLTTTHYKMMEPSRSKLKDEAEIKKLENAVTEIENELSRSQTNSENFCLKIQSLEKKVAAETHKKTSLIQKIASSFPLAVSSYRDVLADLKLVLEATKHDISDLSFQISHEASLIVHSTVAKIRGADEMVAEQKMTGLRETTNNRLKVASEKCENANTRFRTFLNYIKHDIEQLLQTQRQAFRKYEICTAQMDEKITNIICLGKNLYVKSWNLRLNITNLSSQIECKDNKVALLTNKLSNFDRFRQIESESTQTNVVIKSKKTQVTATDDAFVEQIENLKEKIVENQNKLQNSSKIIEREKAEHEQTKRDAILSQKEATSKIQQMQQTCNKLKSELEEERRMVKLLKGKQISLRSNVDFKSLMNENVDKIVQTTSMENCQTEINRKHDVISTLRNTIQKLKADMVNNIETNENKLKQLKKEEISRLGKLKAQLEADLLKITMKCERLHAENAILTKQSKEAEALVDYWKTVANSTSSKNNHADNAVYQEIAMELDRKWAETLRRECARVKTETTNKVRAECRGDAVRNQHPSSQQI